MKTIAFAALVASAAAIEIPEIPTPVIAIPSLRASLTNVHDKLHELMQMGENVTGFADFQDKINELANNEHLSVHYESIGSFIDSVDEKLANVTGPFEGDFDSLNAQLANLTDSLNGKIADLNFTGIEGLDTELDLALDFSSLQEKLNQVMDSKLEAFTNTTGLLNDKLADVDTLLAEHNQTLPTEVYDILTTTEDKYNELHQQLVDLIAQLSGSAAADENSGEQVV